MKKIVIALVSIAVVVAAVFVWSAKQQVLSSKSCAFCNPAVIQTHMFYEDSLVRGLCSHKPIQSGHCMAIVKRHVERLEEVTEEEWNAMGRLIKRINNAMQKMKGPCSYLILQKNGAEVGQTVPHVHMHYIPKEVSPNRVAAWGLLWNFFISPFQRPVSQEQLELSVKNMQQALPGV